MRLLSIVLACFIVASATSKSTHHHEAYKKLFQLMNKNSLSKITMNRDSNSGIQGFPTLPGQRTSSSSKSQVEIEAMIGKVMNDPAAEATPTFTGLFEKKIEELASKRP